MTPQQQALIDWLSPKKSKGTNTETRTIMGEALTDSSYGEVLAAFATDVSDGAENGNREVSNRISLPTTVDCRAGDKLIISLYGNSVFKRPTVTGVAAGGDRTQREVSRAQSTANAASIEAAGAKTKADAAAEAAQAAQDAADIAQDAADQAQRVAEEAGDTGAAAANAAAEAQETAEDAQAAADLAGSAAEAAQQAADDAAAAAAATNQYFFHDGNGAHVATTEGSARTGPNLLLSSLGTFLRDGTDVKSQQTSTGFSVFDNTALAARFGATCQVGKSTSKNMLMDGNGILLRDDTNFLMSLMGSGLTVYDGAGTEAANQYAHFGSTSFIGKPTSGNPNLVLDASGILQRIGTNNLSTQTASGFTVFDGQGNNTANQVAHFGATSFIGKSTSGTPNLVLDASGILQRLGTNYLSSQTSNGFTVYDGSGNSTSNQVAHFGATSFIGNNSSGYQLTMNSSEISVIDWAQDPFDLVSGKTIFHAGESTSVATWFTLGARAYQGFPDSERVHHTSAIGQNSATIGYANSAGVVNATAIGTQNAITGGSGGTAIGCGNAIAGGHFATTIGYGLYAPSTVSTYGQTIVGTNNAADNTAQFIVGGGEGEFRNVFTVYRDKIRTDRGSILSQNLLWEGYSTGQTITLNSSLDGYKYLEVFFCTNDSSRICDSTRIYYGDTQNFVVNLSTSITFSTTGFAVKNAAYRIHPWSGPNGEGQLIPYAPSGTAWGGQLLFNNVTSGQVTNGNYIYVLRVLGFRE